MDRITSTPIYHLVLGKGRSLAGRSRYEWQDTPRMLCRLSSAWRTSILLVIALALQLQTILGEQLASDDQAADVVDIGTVISLGDGIARVYGCEA